MKLDETIFLISLGSLLYLNLFVFATTLPVLYVGLFDMLRSEYEALQNMFTMLKSGGLFIGNIHQLIAELKHAVSSGNFDNARILLKSGKDYYIECYNRSELENIMSAIGFTDIRIGGEYYFTLSEYPQTGPNVDKFVETAAGWDIDLAYNPDMTASAYYLLLSARKP